MGKFLVRLTIIIVSSYYLLSYIIAQLFGVDILDYSATILFELCVVIYSFSEGKYHCKYIKWTMLSVFLCDFVSHLQFFTNFLSINEHNLLCIVLLACGMGTSLIKALNHFWKVNKLISKRQKMYGSVGGNSKL